MFPNLVTYHVYRGPSLPPPDAIAYQYLLAGNGVFLRAENRFVASLVRLASCQVRGLPPLAGRLQLKVPRLPARLLAQVVADAGQIRDGRGRLREALYYFHHTGSRIRVTRPAQRATTISVTSGDGGDVDVILDLHSHGAMRAFFSPADDADDQGFRFSAVLGRLDGRPEIRLRLNVYGYHLALPVTALFDGSGDLVDCYSSDALTGDTGGNPASWLAGHRLANSKGNEGRNDRGT
ncbi:MAG: Mov34/MPN/PAD-1 family protein [Chloroflexi bacterium]|nr:Mov34/MPN/PAD-1 family protein [Chloroflexota bacterium]